MIKLFLSFRLETDDIINESGSIKFTQNPVLDCVWALIFRKCAYNVSVYPYPCVYDLSVFNCVYLIPDVYNTGFGQYNEICFGEIKLKNKSTRIHIF